MIEKKSEILYRNACYKGNEVEIANRVYYNGTFAQVLTIKSYLTINI